MMALMALTMMEIIDRKCVECGGEIPSHRHVSAKYCGESCRNRAGVKRCYANNSSYREATKNRSRKWAKDNPEQTHRRKMEHKHRSKHGHLDFLNNPELNPKDKFWKARALGFRSMLEVEVYKFLEESGVTFSYESMAVTYYKGGHAHGE